MKKIKHYVDEIDNELVSAAEYAEKYIEYKAMGETSMAGKFKEMAQDELKHAMNMHQLAVNEIEAVKKGLQGSWGNAKGLG